MIAQLNPNQQKCLAHQLMIKVCKSRCISFLCWITISHFSANHSGNFPGTLVTRKEQTSICIIATGASCQRSSLVTKLNHFLMIERCSSLLNSSHISVEQNYFLFFNDFATGSIFSKSSLAYKLQKIHWVTCVRLFIYSIIIGSLICSFCFLLSMTLPFSLLQNANSG